MGATFFDRELKRGSAEMLILALLEEQERHGYDLARLIDGRWVERAGQRRRRYYRLTAAGRKTLARQRGLWEQFVNGLERVARFRPA